MDLIYFIFPNINKDLIRTIFLFNNSILELIIPML